MYAKIIFGGVFVLENIFVAIMCIFALGVGIWTWWYENYKPSDADPLQEESLKENLENE